MTRSLASRIHSLKAVLRGHGILGALELPRPRATIAQSLAVSGWAFSERGAIAAVEAFLGDRVLGRLVYGLARPDVARVFGHLNGLMPGFEGELVVPPDLDGSQHLSVRITDELNNVATYRRSIRIVPRSGTAAKGAGARWPVVEVEAVRWTAESLYVEGWAVWPEAGPLFVAIHRSGDLLGQTRVHLSRPDIATRFPEQPSAIRAGFRLQLAMKGPVLPSNAEHSQDLALDLELAAGGGQRFRRALAVTLFDVSRLPSELRSIAAECATLGGNVLNVLNWGATPDTIRDERVVMFSSISDTESLPYGNRSIDVVVVPESATARLREATRVARTAVVGVGSKTLTVLWRGVVERPPVPSISIVIPVHGQIGHTDACLAQLLPNLPPQFRGEVLVVDDASLDATQTVLKQWQQRDKRVKVLTNEQNVGFLESCNRAAHAASGDVLVFLNNDTLPQPDWLSPLVGTLATSGVGAVGAKLLYPDGTLQEAGGVIFSDGSGWNFGKGEVTPDHPLFETVREVDYCSGAALATPRSLFLDVGGFDKRYSPAYYEDTDYCFRLRERGLKVLYQPASVVIHVEGGTSGTDEQSGVKRSQAVNRETFRNRWQTVLREQHRPPPSRFDRQAVYRHAVRDPAARRALVWAPKLPEHDRESGSRRVYDMIGFLRDAGWAVTFVADSATNGDRYVSMLQQMGVVTFAGRDTAWAGSEFLADPSELVLLGGFDLAILHFWWIGERQAPVFRRYSPATRLLVDSVDLHFLRRARLRYRSRSGEPEVLDESTSAEMRRELNIYATVDGVLTVSQKEADFINDLFADANRAHVVSDAESLRESPFDFNERCGFLFLGNFRHSPNVEALQYLVREIVPRLPQDLLARHPISIVGNDLDASLIPEVEAAQKHLRLVGWVPAIEPYIERSLAMLVPLQHGAGTKRKVIQSTMVKTPCVSTSVGVEGLNLVHNRHVLVADDAPSFAAQVVRLADDRVLWQKLADAALTVSAGEHAREIVRRQFLEVLARVMS
jgi:GT2 family glycosyltransferase